MDIAWECGDVAVSLLPKIGYNDDRYILNFLDMADHVTDDNFESEVLKSDVPVLVDFYATWCGPCKQQAPVIEELAEEYKGKAKIVKLDVDESNGTAQKFQVMSIPTLIFFKGGEPVNKLVGFNSKETLSKEIDAML